MSIWALTSRHPYIVLFIYPTGTATIIKPCPRFSIFTITKPFSITRLTRSFRPR